MNTAFHPTDVQLIEYSAGSLPASLSLCISAHLGCCEQCRRQMARLDAVAGVMFEQLTPGQVSDTLLDTIFSRIDASTNSRAGQVHLDIRTPNALPSSINKLIGYDTESLHWRDHGRHVRSAMLLEESGIKASLLHIRRGAKIPTHTHRGNEYTVVLAGSFSDSEGVYHKGDFIKRDTSDHHAPIATADADCYCLVALDAPLRFHNPLMELYNRVSPL